MKKLIIIPAYNEEKSLDKVIADIRENASDFDYIIINDCSTDNTYKMCKMKGYNVLNLPVNLGIGGGVQAGYKYAKEYDYDIAIQFDGDGQHNAAYINDLLEHMIDNNLDMVIGSRFINKEGFQSSLLRRVGIKFLDYLIRTVAKVKVTDPTSGFRIVNKKVIHSFSQYYPSDYPEPESIAMIHRQGFKIGEIPVEMRERTEGKSSINFNRSVYYMIKVSIAILIDCLKERNEGGLDIWS